MSQEIMKEFYSNDIVYRFDKNKKIIFGVVVDSYAYDASNNDVDDSNALQKGQLRLSWTNSSREQTWRQSKVRLMNRSIIPGDIVRRLEKGKETQRGYCKETKQVATVQIVGTDKVIEHVPTDRLHNVRPFDVDDAVCLGSKFGRIEAIDQMILMQSKDGSIVELLTSINSDLDDFWLSKRNRLSLDVYYPGQEVICIPSNFEQPNWIKKTKTMKRNIQLRQRFTIQSVTDMMIEVALYNSKSGYPRITEISKTDVANLKVLEHPNDVSLELLERRLLKLSSHDVLLKKKDWVRKLSMLYRAEVPKIRHVLNSKIIPKVPRIRSSSLLYPTTPSPAECNNPPTFPSADDGDDDWWTEEGEESDEGESASSSQPGSIVEKKVARKKHYPPKPNELIPGNTLPVEIICVESKVTIVWQDGTQEKDISSTQLYYSFSLDDHEFFPGEWVLKNESRPTLLEALDGKYGVVQKVDYMERTASIKWFVYTAEAKKPEVLSVEELSVYDLKKHSKFVFRPGSIVRANPAAEGKLGKVVDSCIEGYVIVQWVDNVEENCWPQDIELIPDSTEYDYSDSGDSSNEDKVSWETESIESYAGGDLTDEIVLQNMAARLDFVRSRIIYLKEAFKNHTITENFSILKDLLLVYENSSYLDKLLGTSFFSLKSKHFQALLMQAKDKAKAQNIELKGRLFSNDNGMSMTKVKLAETENIKKMIKLENRINAEIEKKENKDGTGQDPSTPLTPDSVEIVYITNQENLCVELLSTLKVRMDLAYAEIISRIGGNQALSVLTKATEQTTPATNTPLPSWPTTPDDSFSVLSPLKPKKSLMNIFEKPKLSHLQLVPVESTDWYQALDESPESHHYYDANFVPNDEQKFLKALSREYKLLKESLPPNVWVRSYSDRIDLLSVMIGGPAKTPYEDGLFLFDIQLSNDYPRSPPLVHYISYSSERLNPNLYVEGKVCVSLLGTWMGKGTEVWGPNSTLLQLFVSIQGLILVAEPYYNEAGFEKQTDTQQGYENSRTYNELVILKLVQSMTALLSNPPSVFKMDILNHFSVNGQKLCDRLEKFCSDSNPLKPDFPLLPVSKGLKLSLTSALEKFKSVLECCLASLSEVEIAQINSDEP